MRGHLADGQCSVFVRNRKLFANEPFNITTDEPFVDELTGLITRLALGGLLHAPAPLAELSLHTGEAEGSKTLGLTSKLKALGACAAAGLERLRDL